MNKGFFLNYADIACPSDGEGGGREGGREGGWEGGREGGREGRREGGREGGRDSVLSVFRSNILRRNRDVVAPCQ